jgi:hypothetical protein
VGQNASPPSLARSKPFRVRQKRDVVNRDREGYAKGDWRRVGGSKEHVGFVGADSAPERRLFPPGAGAAGNDSSFG